MSSSRLRGPAARRRRPPAARAPRASRARRARRARSGRPTRARACSRESQQTNAARSSTTLSSSRARGSFAPTAQTSAPGRSHSPRSTGSREVVTVTTTSCSAASRCDSAGSAPTRAQNAASRSRPAVGDDALDRRHRGADARDLRLGLPAAADHAERARAARARGASRRHRSRRRCAAGRAGPPRSRAASSGRSEREEHDDERAPPGRRPRTPSRPRSRARGRRRHVREPPFLQFEPPPRSVLDRARRHAQEARLDGLDGIGGSEQLLTSLSERKSVTRAQCRLARRCYCLRCGRPTPRERHREFAPWECRCRNARAGLAGPTTSSVTFRFPRPAIARMSWQRPSRRPDSVTTLRPTIEECVLTGSPRESSRCTVSDGRRRGRARAPSRALAQHDVRVDLRDLTPRDANSAAAAQPGGDPSEQPGSAAPDAGAAENRDDFERLTWAPLEREIVDLPAAPVLRVEQLVVEDVEGEIERSVISDPRS